MRSPDPKVTIVSGDPVTTVRELKAEVGGWEATWSAVPVTQGDGKRGEAVTIADHCGAPRNEHLRTGQHPGDHDGRPVVELRAVLRRYTEQLADHG
jgi:hypothetical protein